MKSGVTEFSFTSFEPEKGNHGPDMDRRIKRLSSKPTGSNKL
jgi:hypothetical protein